MKKIITLLIIINILFLLNHCTKNPFSNDDNNKIKKEKIKGKVILSDGVTPDNIFVWLEEFNLSTYTDSNGEFSLTLPLPETQANGNSYNGKFGVFYYSGNYKMDSITIELAEGKLVPDQFNIDNNGKIRHSKILYPYLNYEAQVLDPIIIGSDSITLIIDVNINIYDDINNIFSFRKYGHEKDRPYTRTGMIFEPVDKENYEPILIKSEEGYLFDDHLKKDTSMKWKFEITLIADDFYETDYLIYPYLVIDQPEVPEKLLDVLGKEKMEFGIDYLDYPIKKEPKIVKIEKMF